MVGEISPDGKFVWDGSEWKPIEANEAEQNPENQITNNVFQLNPQGQEGDLEWQPVAEKSQEGGKVKIIAMSIVGLLIVTALSWVVYAFVIDPMLYPDPYSKDKFFSVVGDQPSEEEVLSGEAGPWVCSVELEMEDDGMKIKTEFDMYVSEDSARSYSKISAGIFGWTSSDVWIDETQVVWETADPDGSNTSKVLISSLDYSPSHELIANSSGPTEMCFLHHEIVESMKNDPGQKFSSDKERFPDEEGVRAVKVETKMEIEGEDGEMNIAVYFDEDDNMLGTKIENSTFECIVTSELKSFSEPGWTSVSPNAPMLLDLSEDYIYDMNHSTEIVTQYNATYSLTSDSDQKIVIYDDEWDDESDSEVVTILYEVSIEDAMSEGGALIEVPHESWDGEESIVNCTINYTDVDSDSSISSGDVVDISCERSVFFGEKLGIADENGVAEQVNMEVPWISPIFTIIALLGAAMLVSRRDLN